VTEFSKTFPVFYKWPDLTDVQVMLTGTVVHRYNTPSPICRAASQGLVKVINVSYLRIAMGRATMVAHRG
jgi:hypothetical protein